MQLHWSRQVERIPPCSALKLVEHGPVGVSAGQSPATGYLPLACTFSHAAYTVIPVEFLVNIDPGDIDGSRFGVSHDIEWQHLMI